MGNTISAASLDVESDEDLQETLRWCQDTKRCPGLNCGQLTMSSGGGDDITCQMCGHRYCWECLHPVHRGPVPPCLDCRETGVTQPTLPPAAALMESIRDARRHGIGGVNQKHRGTYRRIPPVPGLW